MAKSEQLYLVLWAHGFDEAMAVIFITELRRANLRVKVVGLTRRPSRGAYGLALVPDISLDEALPLAADAVWVVVPCASAGLSQLRADPRVPGFFQAAHGARLITGSLKKQDRSLFPRECEPLEIALGDGQLVDRIRKMVA